MNIKCLGCGANIQTTNPNKKGYIDPVVLNKHNDDFYCKRCFDLKHYNRSINIEVNMQEYQKNLQKIAKDKGLIVLVVDMFDFEGSLIYNINKLFASENILLVLNKADLFIDSLNRNKLISYVREYLKQANIKIKDLILMSSFKKVDISMLIEKIRDYYNGRNIYFVGMTNVGKSSIINKIIEHHTNEANLIVVSNTVNTTLDNIHIPFTNDSSIIDTPGIINDNNLIYYLDKQTLEYITPKSFIKPKTFQIYSRQTLFVQGFIRLDVLSGDNKCSLITHFKNNLLIHRTKLENADGFYSAHIDDILKYPTATERKKLGNMITKTFIFNTDEKKDIAISGLGFICVYGNCSIKVHYFENVKVILRKAMI